MKICERCKKYLAREGISLCDSCYKIHNEIYGVSTASNKKPIQKKEVKTNHIIVGLLATVIIATSVYFLLTLDFSAKREERPFSGIILEGQDMTMLADNVYFYIKGYSKSDCVIKLHNTIIDKSIVFYLQNEQYSIQSIPIGYYRMKAACGSEWLNSVQHFGLNTLYFQTEELLEIFSDFSIILEPDEPGTIPIHTINKPDF